MKRSLPVLALSAGLVLSGCAGGGSDYSTLSEKQVTASLLTVDELGPGWTRDKDESDSEDDDIAVLKGNSSCKTLFADDEDDTTVDSDEVSFSQGDTAASFIEMVSTNTPDTIEEEFDTLRDAIERCRTFVSDLDESKPIVTVRPTEGPDLGDGSFAFTFSATLEGVPPITARGIAVRLGDNAVTFTSIGLKGSELPGEKLQTLVEKGVAKVEKQATTV